VPFFRSSLVHLGETLDDSGDIVLFVDRAPDGRLVIIDCNHTASIALGRERTAIIGTIALQDLIEPGQTASLAKLTEATVSRCSRNGDLRLCSASGASFWFGYHVMPCPSDPALSMILGRDITARRAEREQSNFVQGLLAKVFTMVETGVSIIGPDGRFLMTNPFHDRMLGYPPGSLNGRQSRDTLAPESLAAMKQTQQTAFTKNENLTSDLWLLRADGYTIAARMHSSLVDGADGKKLRVVTVNPLPGPPRPPLEVRLLTAGKIRLITVEQVRLKLGDRWAALERKVLDIAEQIIRRQLEPPSTFSRTHDQAFVICFQGMSEDEATRKAETIGREIRTKLIGLDGDEGEAVEVIAVVASLPVAIGVDPQAAADARLAKLEQQVNQPAHDHLSQASPILATKNGDRMGFYLQLPTRLPDGGRIALPPARVDRSVRVLRLAGVQAASNQSDYAYRVPVLFPLDFEVFQSRGTTEPFVAACRSLAPGAYKNLLPVLTGLPPGLAFTKLFDVVQRLTPFCCAVGFHIEAQNQPIPNLTAGPTPFLLVDGADWARTADLPARFLGTLVSAVKPFKGKVVVRNVMPGDVTRELAALGVDLFVEPE